MLKKSYKDNKVTFERFLDLIENSRRRRNSGRYDDAVARLYRATEMIGEIALNKHGINSSGIRWNKISPDVLNQFKCYNFDNLPRNLNLFENFLLLKALNDPIGNLFISFNKKNKPELLIKESIDRRNKSLLAHGETPCTVETYDEYFELLMDIIDDCIEHLSGSSALGIFKCLENYCFPEIPDILHGYSE